MHLDAVSAMGLGPVNQGRKHAYPGPIPPSGLTAPHPAPSHPLHPADPINGPAVGGGVAAADYAGGAADSGGSFDGNGGLLLTDQDHVGLRRVAGVHFALAGECDDALELHTKDGK